MHPPFRLIPLLLLLCLLLTACDDGNTATSPQPPQPPAGTTQPAAYGAPPTATPLVSQPAPQGGGQAAPLAPVTAVDAELAIYTTVGRDLVQRLAPASFSTLYVNPYAGSGETLDTNASSRSIPAALPGALGNASFSDFAAVLDQNSEDGMTILPGGAYITLGEISYFDAGGQRLADGSGAASATLRGSIYQSRGAAMGLRYTVTGDGGGWRITQAQEEWRAEGWVSSKMVLM